MLNSLRSRWFAAWWFHPRMLWGRRKSKYPQGKAITAAGPCSALVSDADSYGIAVEKIGPVGKQIEVPA